MAKLSNINGKFAVEDTGAIRFSDQTGTTGQILKSNGNSAPTWVDPNTVGTGPWLPLAGGVVSGATTFQSSLTVGGTLTVNGSGGSVFNSTGASNHIIAAYRASNGNNVATFRTTDSGYIFRIHAQNAGTIYVQNDDGSNYIKIPDSGSNEVSGNTTFAGTVLIDGLSNYTGLTVKGAGASRPAILFENVNQGSLGMIYATEGDAIVINTGSDAVTIDSSGNVGIGVTPFAHTLGTSASLDLKGFGGIWGYAGATYVNSNAYYDSGWKYKTTAPAAVLQVGGSSQELTFRQAVSGTAGNAITYTQPFTIDTSGNVGIGTNSPSYKLVVSNGGASGIEFSPNALTGMNEILSYNRSGAAYEKLRFSTLSYEFYTSTVANALTILNGGNVGIGVTSPTHKLHVYSAVPTGGIGLKVESGNVTNWIQNKSTGSSWQIGSTGSGFQLYNDDTSSYRFIVENGGNVGIGTTSPGGLLTIKGTGDAIRVESTNTGAGGAQIDLLHFTTSPADNDTFALINMGGYYTGTTSVYGTSIKSIWTDVSARDAALTFSTNNGGTLAERMRITSGGTVFIDKDTAGIANDGIELKPFGQSNFTCTGGEGINVNRKGSDGNLMRFYNDSVEAGTISVSGGTVSYNGFAGCHESSGINSDVAIGTVVSTIDELDTRVVDEEIEDIKDHAKIKISDEIGDKRVYGVLQTYSEENDKPKIASVGIGSILVTGSCEGGDLLVSNGDGTAKVQDDDIVRSKTIGKVTIGNTDTEVKLVSCVLYCG